MKSILFISYNYPPDIGGQNRTNAHLAAQFRKYFHVDVVTRFGNRSKEKNVYPVLIRYIPLFFNLTLLLLVNRRKYDLVIAGESSISAEIASLYGVLTKTKMISFAHGWDLRNWNNINMYRKILKKVFRRNKLIIANSNKTSLKAKKLGISQNIVVINPGVNLSKFKIINQDENPIYARNSPKSFNLLTVTRLIKRKGLEYIMHALKEIEEPINWFIIGAGPEMKRLKTLSKELGLEERVHFLNALNDEEVLWYYNFCDVFILTPYEIKGKNGQMDYEGFGLVYLEANACGKPVIASNSGGISDAVKNDYSGILVEPQDSSSIRTAIRKLASNKSLYHQLSINSLQWAKSFDWNIQSEKHIEEIQKAFVN